MHPRCGVGSVKVRIARALVRCDSGEEMDGIDMA